MTETQQADFEDVREQIKNDPREQLRRKYHAILNSFNRDGCMVQNAPQIAEFIGCSRAKAFGYLEELETAGILEKHDLGNAWAWRIIGNRGIHPGDQGLRDAVDGVARVNTRDE